MATTSAGNSGDETPRFYVIEVVSGGTTSYVITESLLVISAKDEGAALVQNVIHTRPLRAASISTGKGGGSLPSWAALRGQSGGPSVNITINNKTDSDPN